MNGDAWVGAERWAGAERWFQGQCRRALGLPNAPRGAFARLRFAVHAAGENVAVRQRAGGYLVRELVDDFFTKPLRPSSEGRSSEVKSSEVKSSEDIAVEEYVGLLLQQARLLTPKCRRPAAKDFIEAALLEDRASVSPLLEQLLRDGGGGGTGDSRTTLDFLQTAGGGDSMTAVYQTLMRLLRPWVIQRTAAGAAACALVRGLMARLPADSGSRSSPSQHNFECKSYALPLEDLLLSKLKRPPTEEDKAAARTVMTCYSDLLRSRGFQAKLPPAVWEYLINSLHTDFELFASPFNNTLERCCTLFPEQDRYFLPQCAGSAFRLLTGPPGRVVEINPPFGEALLEMVVDLVESWLEAAVAVDVVLFLPYWAAEGPNCSFIAKAGTTLRRWQKAAAVLPAGSHGYVDPVTGTWFPSACATLVLYLSNDGGASASLNFEANFSESLQRAFTRPVCDLETAN